ncbi:hypothetical protein RP20_CCG011200 [Aedes albopictus]|nr:hypothetical protein RP20_CCG011200 [Aedes albopictus]
MCSKCSNKAKRWWSLGISVGICVIAIALGVSWPFIIEKEVEKQFVFTPGTQLYDNWLNPPIDTLLELYLWNWTNTEDYRSDNYKPHLEQLGPYTFREKKERVDLKWDDDEDTLTFYQRRIWHFEPELSKGDLENDMVVTINPILLTIGFMMQDSPYQDFIDSILNLNPQFVDNPFYNVRVKDILFDGYDDVLLANLIKLLEDNEGLAGLFELPPFDKFGWFYGRNESETYDGNFTIARGTSNFQDLGILKLWNAVNQTEFYRDECGAVHGTTGELWPPFQDRMLSNVTVFSSDICSAMTLEYDGGSRVHGIAGLKWKGNERVFNNGNNYTETECQCTAPKEQCPVLKSGAMDVSRCKMGAPATVSYPHFYLADESYLAEVEGLKPEEEEHKFIMVLEPHTGIPLQVKAQLQVNLDVKEYGLTLLKDIPEVMLPVLWFRQTAQLNEELASDLKLLLILPNIGIYVAVGIGILGIACLAMYSYYSLKVWK